MDSESIVIQVQLYERNRMKLMTIHEYRSLSRNKQRVMRELMKEAEEAYKKKREAEFERLFVFDEKTNTYAFPAN